ncbi:MAG: DUF378 domain-containing protein [Candidatus Levybacteria bacterium RIFCSPLOWO2_12_FULL_37_14]|nr:MAG: DUF378 domain-containing protein [Candidatus Levybacteria bacterium RIFCSPLOWO2_12_FULL_37_14]
MKRLQQLANILVLVGAINWGLVGLFKYNLVESLLGGLGLVQIIYILIGLSGVLMLVNWGKK